MNALREVLSLQAGMSSANRLWLLGAAIAAVLLLSFYVNLLHEQVARGEQLRQSVRGAAHQAVSRMATLPTSLTVPTRRQLSIGDEDAAR